MTDLPAPGARVLRLSGRDACLRDANGKAVECSEDMVVLHSAHISTVAELQRELANSEAGNDELRQVNVQLQQAVTAACSQRDSLQRQVGEMRELVQRAFNEGVRSGMDEHRKFNGGVTWTDSKACAALAALQVKP